MKRNIGLFLITASIIYVVAVIIGGFMKENYNHIYNSISELSESGTKKIFIVELFSIIYYTFLVSYSLLTLFIYKHDLNKIQITISILLLLCGILGFIMLIFPQDHRYGQFTMSGIIHFIGASIASIDTMICTFLSWINYRKEEKSRKYAFYSLVTFVIIFFTCLINPILFLIHIDSFFGLIERITIGSFLIWLFITGFLHYKGKLLDK